jgi:hypothetical protein
MPTLAALLGHAKLDMIRRYVHPQEEHQIQAVKKLGKANAARQIAEFEKKKQGHETAATIPATVPENPANFSKEKTEGNPQKIN